MFKKISNSRIIEYPIALAFLWLKSFFLGNIITASSINDAMMAM
jgi:hypothetical protein